MVAVVQGDRNRRITERLAVFSSRKDDILHASAPKLLDALFSQHPSHSIGDVALPASVGAYDPSNTVMEIKFYLMCKRLESLHLYTF